jgi:hypothetical protein
MGYESRQALLDGIPASHHSLSARLSAIPSNRCHEPGVWGDGWTLSDPIVHLAG